MRRLSLLIPALLCLSGCSMMPGHSAPAASRAALEQQVRDTENAFARSMDQRDFKAFSSFLDDEAIFFSGSGPLRGREAIEKKWKPMYESKEPPFSWKAETVQVLDSGELALSSGPVFDGGKQTSTFSSIWRRQANGQWKVIFDKGCPGCPCAVLPKPTPKHKL